MTKLISSILPIVCFSKNLYFENRLNPPARELMDVEIINDIMIIPGNLDGYDFYDISNINQPSGIYFIQLSFDLPRSIQKVILIK